VLFKETWIRIDRDGDGIAELRRVCQVGKTLLADEEADIVPVAAFCPILMAHQHQGVSVYDMVSDLAKLKTALLRQFMDNKYLSNNSRVFANENVNLDDLLISRPGGVVRVLGTGNIGDAAMPWVVPDTGPSALQGLEYLDSVRENRTGYTRQSQGLETDALVSKTVGGMAMQLSQSQLRLEMIARTIAETGVRELFRIIHALTLKHSTRSEKVRLRGKWVEVNPREWVRRVDLSISVGIGSASQQTMMQSLMVMSAEQEKALPMGLVSADNIYNMKKKLANAAGFRNAEEFFTPPKQNPQTGKAELPPPPPNPMVQVKQMELQGDAQKTQAIHMHDQQMAQMEAMLKQRQLEMDAALKQKEQEGALALQQSNDQRQSQLDQQKFQLDMRAQDMARDEAIQLANIKAASAAQVARINHGLDEQYELQRQQEKEAGYQIMQNEIAAAKDEMAQRMAAPKRVLRDATGRVAGVEHAGVVHAVVRDANGKIVGTQPQTMQ
jgi:hypothetical protein